MRGQRQRKDSECRHTTLGRQKQEDLCEFRANLVYRASSRSAQGNRVRPCLKNERKKERKEDTGKNDAPKEPNRGGGGEMAQQLRALTALSEVLSSVPSNHTVAHNLL